MDADYKRPVLTVGVEAALDALMRAARRDGYEMNAGIRLTVANGGASHYVTNIRGEWRELVEVGNEAD